MLVRKSAGEGLTVLSERSVPAVCRYVRSQFALKSPAGTNPVAYSALLKLFLDSRE